MTALLSALVATTRPDSPGPAGTMLQESRGYVAGWGTLALINAGLAQGKNRSGLNWFLLSLLMGPFATFILVALCENLPGPGAKADKPVAEAKRGQ